MQDERLMCQHQMNEPNMQGIVLIQDSEATTSLTPRSSGKETFMGRDAEEARKRPFFNCNERYTPGHKCRAPHVFVIENKQPWEVVVTKGGE